MFAELAVTYEYLKKFKNIYEESKLKRKCCHLTIDTYKATHYFLKFTSSFQQFSRFSTMDIDITKACSVSVLFID